MQDKMQSLILAKKYIFRQVHFDQQSQQLLILGFVLSFLLAPTFISMFLYWFLLGVISSIGIGVGVPTGLLVLFPYLLELSQDRSFWVAFLAGYPSAFIWGLGTATGEIVPFLIARQVQHLSIEELKWNPQGTGWCVQLARMVLVPVQFMVIDTTFWLVKRFRTMALILLASWPNMAFDVCGLACGALGLSWTEFLTGLFIGKALIKTLWETAVVIYVGSITHVQLPWYLQLLWNGLVLVCFLKFVLSAIQEMANRETQYTRETVSSETVAKKH